ncbi:ATP-dependent DNA ligase [bacterium]|nr:MAG: ATP-dependent DNA ligase [bacterium]
MAPMEARTVAALPEGSGWQYEPKWDGFRCVAVRNGGEVQLIAKSGKPLHRYFPEIAATLASSPALRFLLDGELIVPVAGGLSFDALQMRLHPAESRIRKLSVETPASYVVFDLLADGERDWTAEPLMARRAALQAFVRQQVGVAASRAFGPAALRALKPGRATVRLSAATRKRSEAEAWLADARGTLDGLIAKKLDAPYLSGERAMLKYKQLRTADCVVGGFRYASASKQVGSLLLGLYDDAGLLHHVGYTSSIAAKDRPALTKKLQALREAPGFTGDAPGGPSRWSTMRSAQWEPIAPELVVEVCYDHVSGDRFRHGTKLLRWRPDKAPRQCRFEQIGVKR